MSMRRLVLSSCAWLVLAMAACAAPSAQPQAADASQAQATTDTQDSAAAAPARDLDKLRKLKVRTGGPLPPRALPEPVKPDRSCRSDADCAVKDVGNCCGAGSTGGSSACVSKGSPTDPAAVQAQCAQDGTMPACGFHEIGSCSCVAGICSARTQALAPSLDPVPSPPEQR